MMVNVTPKKFIYIYWRTIMYNMNIPKLTFASAVLLLLVIESAWALSPQEELGKHLFFDKNLSTPSGQSCAVCHGPEVVTPALTRPLMPEERSMKVRCMAVSATASRRRQPMPATARYCPTTGANGLAACSGMAGPPAGLSAIL